MDFVLLALEPPEEAANAIVVLPVALDDEALLFVVQLPPGNVHRHACRLGGSLELGQLRAIVRLRPRLNRALRDRFGWIGHDQVEVELDDVAEPVTGLARAEGVVEREQPRLRRLVGEVAVLTLEPLAEHVRLRIRLRAGRFGGQARWIFNRERRSAGFAVRQLDRIGQPSAHIAFELDAVDDHFQRRLIAQLRRADVVDHHRPSVDVEPVEPFPAKLVERKRQRSGRGRRIPNPQSQIPNP